MLGGHAVGLKHARRGHAVGLKQLEVFVHVKETILWLGIDKNKDCIEQDVIAVMVLPAHQ
jgi:hypothetical protein